MSNDQCKDSGWKTFGDIFKNQGERLRFVKISGGKNAEELSPGDSSKRLRPSAGLLSDEHQKPQPSDAILPSWATTGSDNHAARPWSARVRVRLLPVDETAEKVGLM